MDNANRIITFNSKSSAVFGSRRGYGNRGLMLHIQMSSHFDLIDNNPRKFSTVTMMRLIRIDVASMIVAVPLFLFLFNKSKTFKLSSTDLICCSRLLEKNVELETCSILSFI